MLEFRKKYKKLDGGRLKTPLGRKRFKRTFVVVEAPQPTTLKTQNSGGTGYDVFMNYQKRLNDCRGFYTSICTVSRPRLLSWDIENPKQGRV